MNKPTFTLDDLIAGVDVPPGTKSINELERIQDYRFGSMLKGEHYAFARGLTINPTHLPQALDAMREDNWHLIAIFGQTNAADIGFIFERVRDGKPPSFDGAVDILVSGLAKAQTEVLRLNHRVDELLRANTALVEANRKVREERDRLMDINLYDRNSNDPV